MPIRTHARDVRGFTPLHAAAARDNTAVVRAYVAAKLDLNETTAWGGTPLDLALAHRAADALAEAGATSENDA